MADEPARRLWWIDLTTEWVHDTFTEVKHMKLAPHHHDIVPVIEFNPETDVIISRELALEVSRILNLLGHCNEADEIKAAMGDEEK